MGHAVGVLAMEHIAAGLVEHDKLSGSVRLYPQDATAAGALQTHLITGHLAGQLHDAPRDLGAMGHDDDAHHPLLLRISNHCEFRNPIRHC